jgi:pimeloyl-ACP methyl ester carboxylesterase
MLLALILAACVPQAPVAALPQALPALARAVPTDAIPVGKSQRKVRLGDRELLVYFHRPEHWQQKRMLLVMHGVLRNADDYRDHAVAMGDRFDALIVAPKFDSERFPSRAYQRGGILREDGSAAPPAEWTYALIPQLAAEVRKLVGKEHLPYWIIGHSAGGQFVMRMSAFQDTGAERLVAANPGTDLFPLRSRPFGYGFGGLPEELSSDERIRRYLAAPLTIYLGTADDAPDEDFETSDNGMQQGAGRHQRGLGCYWTAKTVAELRGWPFGWRLVEAPGIGHDHELMFQHPNCEKALLDTGGLPPPAPSSGLRNEKAGKESKAEPGKSGKE